MIIPFPSSHARSAVHPAVRPVPASMPEAERRSLLEALRRQLLAAGPHGATRDLQVALRQLGCASEHEALLTALDLLLDAQQPASAPTSAAGRASTDFVYSSLY